MPIFSVVISVYNKAEYIKNTLNSVINQSFNDFEVIVVNDGSSDNSLEIINSINDERISVITTENLGASMARNKGIEASKSDFIALLDGDDYWDKNYLKTIYEAISNFPNQNIFSVAIAQKYKNKIVPVNYSFKQIETFGIHNFFKSSKKYSLLSSSSVVFHKDIIKKTGKFDPSIVSGQDTDLWIRFGLHFDIVFINKQLVTYTYNTNSLSNTTFNLSQKPKFDNYRTYEKNNHLLKAYLDKNRYSMAILSKFQNDIKSFEFYINNIDFYNLNTKQKLLLKSPLWCLKLLQKVKSIKGEKIYYRED
ncbi:MAG: glycosyltransferase family 2 protein [Winogradskyella sp.]|uniref:glycosyltransferase family 2 protein n=1 Tax=Winogradskyella sp. TaxID=1883156 RepID=UPI0025D399A3|nr:glycosyltransferase family 2 protein [Winogradskyella sp.]NRB83692.1 glycosyltransferase family 2 protein [Winogradskyella sp.]